EEQCQRERELAKQRRRGWQSWLPGEASGLLKSCPQQHKGVCSLFADIFYLLLIAESVSSVPLQEAWMLSRERELKEELRRERDKEIELAIWTLEEETSKDKEACERAADNRVKRLREKYGAELRELEHSERAAVEKVQELRKQQVEAEGELIRLQAVLKQKEAEIQDITQTKDKLAEERRSLAEVIRQEFADRLVMTEEENRRLKVEVSEVRARLRLEVERITHEKEEELAEVHQR
ncbi:hypothetical protein XENOCAPTIV_001409, partial [Xenoophorus captivus]